MQKILSNIGGHGQDPDPNPEEQRNAKKYRDKKPKKK